MKILLYLEAEKFLRKSGIGRAIYHQKRALEIAGIDYTTDPHEDFDIAHINTYGIRSVMLLFRVKRMGKKSFTTVTRQKKTLEILLLGQTY